MAEAGERLRDMIFNRKGFAMIGLLVIAGFLRLYQINRFMQFQGDEGRDALVLWKLAVQGKWTLIGPGTSIGNMYNGPLYYYLVLPSFAASGLSPVGPSVFVALVGVATVWLIYWTGREWFSPVAGATAATLYAVSPTVIMYSRSSWNPNVMPFFALLCIFAIWEVYRGKNLWWLVVSSGSLAFALQSHYLGLLLMPTVFIWWLLSWRRTLTGRDPVFGRFSVYAILVFVVLMSPIVLFDLRHNFVNLRAMWVFFTQRQTTVNFRVYKAVPNMVPIFERMVTTLVATGWENLGVIISGVIGLGGIVQLFRREERESLWLVATWMLFGLIGLGLYKQSIYDHYFGFLFPAVFFLLGLVVDFLWRRRGLYFVGAMVSIVGLVYLNISRTPILASPNDLYLHTVVVSKVIVEASEGKAFNLGMIANQNYDAGYRFILTEWGAALKEVPPDITDQLFVVCELPVDQCKPVGNPKAEIANFGWVKIDRSWTFPWGVTLFRLVHYKP